MSQLRPLHVRYSTNAFTIVELLIAITVSIIVVGSLITLLFFGSRDFSSFVSGSYVTQRLDVAAYKIIEDFLRTGRVDPLNPAYSPIKEIDPDGKYIIYQILTPDENGLVFKETGFGSNWGDGKEVGKFVRLILKDDILWRETGSYSAGTFVPEDKQALISHAEFWVKGISAEGEENNVAPIALTFGLGATTVDDKVYSRSYIVRLRN